MSDQSAKVSPEHEATFRQIYQRHGLNPDRDLERLGTVPPQIQEELITLFLRLDCDRPADHPEGLSGYLSDLHQVDVLTRLHFSGLSQEIAVLEKMMRESF